MIKKYLVESRKSYDEIFDNYVYDYMYTRTEREAINRYKDILGLMGASDEELANCEYRAREVG